MPKLQFGNKPGVGPVVKVMKNNDDDAFTTPNSEQGKFLFNSEAQKIGYIDQIFEVTLDHVNYPPGGSYYDPASYFIPPGSNLQTALIMIESYIFSGKRYQEWSFFKEYFGKPFLPLVEQRQQYTINKNKFDGPIAREGGNIDPNDDGFAFSRSGYEARSSMSNRWNGNDYENRNAVFVGLSDASVDNTNRLLTVYNLPGDSSPIPDYSLPPVAGQEVVRIDKERVRIALPGRTVDDTNPDHFILHENKVPAKIIKAGEIILPASGTYVIETDFKLSKTTYMDFHVRKSSTPDLWEPPYWTPSDPNQNYSFTYVVNDYDVTLTALSNRETVVRYMIIGAENDPPTVGGEKVLFKGNDGTKDFIQIKRPGSSDTEPNLNDIMLDTRLSYLPILAEGLLAWPTDFPITNIPGQSAIQKFIGERGAVVNFANPNNLLPFVKMGVIWPGDPDYQGTYSVRNPTSYWNYHGCAFHGFSVVCDGSTSWAKIGMTSVTFYAAASNPLYFTNGGDVDYPSTAIGLRYYIFGIPNNFN